MLRPSPNEFERLKTEEFNKRRILRLKEVREHSKNNASRLRNLYQEQKTKVINKIAANIQEQINLDDYKKLENLKSKYEKQSNAVGEAHNNAADWIDPMILLREKGETNDIFARERHEIAVNQLKIENEKKEKIKNARLDSLNFASLIEKERAAAVAALPPPVLPFYSQALLKDIDDMTPRVKVCDRNKYSVIESYETGSYYVERENGNFDNAMEAGEIRQHHLSVMDKNVAMENEEQSIKAQLRGHQAIKKQIVQKDYVELITNLEHISKGEMSKRQREYYKNEFVGPLGLSHHTSAMMGYKEKCRERAVETVVMESLKDITNKTCSNECEVIIEGSREGGGGKGVTKLSKLYEIIKKQQQNVTFETTKKINEETAAYSFDNDENVIHVEEKEVEEENDGVDIEKENETMSDVAVASAKFNSVLEISNCVKERQMIESKIEHLDRRLDEIKEGESSDKGLCLRENMSDYTQSRSSASQSSILLQSSESICSNSLNIIREFQKNALMKLSGRLSPQNTSNKLYKYNEKFSGFSLESSSVSEQSSYKCSTRPVYKEREEVYSGPSDSHSSVSEWVKTQLLQTIDTIPDWVTKDSTAPQFLPDLNMSFMSSILNIRSGTVSSSLDDTLSSSSTIMTHSSVLRRHRAQSSITEISNIGVVSDNEKLRVENKEESFSSDITEHQSLECVSDLSNRCETSLSSVIKKPEIIGNEQENKEGTEMSKEDNQDEEEEDLINFESVEDLTEQDSSYLKALEELADIAGTSSHCTLPDVPLPVPEDNVLESNSLIMMKELDVPLSQHHLEIPNVDNYLPISNRNIFSTDILNTNKKEYTIDNTLISDYEKFLSGLLDKAVPLPSSTFNYIDESKEFDKEKEISVNRNSEYIINNSVENGVISEIESLKTIQNTIDFKEDQCNISSEHKEPSSVTSTTEETKENPLITLSHSSVHNIEVSPQRLISNELEQVLELSAPDIDSEGSLEPLTPYSSDISEEQPLSIMNSDQEGLEQRNKKRMKKLLSSTMKPERQHIETLSPNISSISSIMSVEACNRLKQKIMEEYFEKNKNFILSVSSGTKSSDFSLKPLESMEDSTPRNIDSGKPSSRLTQADSELNTARLTNDDLFMTPRTEDDDNNNYTDYSPRDDEWSTAHTNFQTLPEYVSSANSFGQNSVECALKNGSLDHVDLDETLKNEDDKETGSCRSLNLIRFDSSADFDKNRVTTHEDYLPKDNHSSQSLSEDSEIIQSNNHYTLQQDNVPSKESSDCNLTSFHPLGSYHSSTQSPSNQLNMQEIREFEAHFNCLPCENSQDSRSEADTSSASLASFLNNESRCQQMANIGLLRESQKSTPKPICAPGPLIVGNEEMKNQLALWKKERLTRINQNLSESGVIKCSNVDKTNIIRKKDEIENRSRTLKLYNNLEEVQKMKKLKESEQIKIANNLKRKEYAEKLRRMKKEPKGTVYK